MKAGYTIISIMYPANLAGTPWCPRLTWLASLTAPSGAGNLTWYPANLAGVPDGPFWGWELYLVPR